MVLSQLLAEWSLTLGISWTIGISLIGYRKPFSGCYLSLISGWELVTRQSKHLLWTGIFSGDSVVRLNPEFVRTVLNLGGLRIKLWDTYWENWLLWSKQHTFGVRSGVSQTPQLSIFKWHWLTVWSLVRLEPVEEGDSSCWEEGQV